MTIKNSLPPSIATGKAFLTLNLSNFRLKLAKNFVWKENGVENSKCKILF